MSAPTPPTRADVRPDAAPVPGDPRGRRRPGTAALALGVVVALVGAVLAWVVAPSPASLGRTVTGDADLAAQVRTAVGDPAGYDRMAVALVEGARVRTVGLGRPDARVGGTTPFETGSVAKVFTGMLFADAVARGEVTPGTTLAQVLPDATFADRLVGGITLGELASHRSGLPRLAPAGPLGVARSLGSPVGVNPYAPWDARAVVDALARTGLDGRGEVHYSNFGMAVLGQALATRAGTDYPTLLAERLLRPLGMTDTRVVADGSPSAGAARPTRSAGGDATLWTGVGYAPAGIGTWTTVADLTRLVRAVAAGTAPGAAAATPRFEADAPDRRIGYAWFTDREDDGQELTWHNGATSGTRTFVGYDRATRRAVVVLSASDADTNHVGRRLLGAEAEAPGRPLVPTITVLVLLAATVLPFVGVAARRRGDRLGAVAYGVSALAALALAHRIGPWQALGGRWVWWAAGVVVAACVGVLAARWPGIPTVAGRRPRLRWVSTTVNVLVAVAIVAAVVALG